MSSIWNPQDRFILSNMTSEKLYAKSPLTTGVSGTSAYIGLEPSATYNETVLFTGNGSKIVQWTASEPLTNFNEVQFIVSTDPNEEGPAKISVPMYGLNTSRLKLGWVGTFNGWRDIVWQYQYNNTNMTTFTAVSGSYWGINSNAIQGNGAWNSDGLAIYKVIGINRKENV